MVKRGFRRRGEMEGRLGGGAKTEAGEAEGSWTRAHEKRRGSMREGRRSSEA